MEPVDTRMAVLLLETFSAPEHDRILLTDPRFEWVTAHVRLHGVSVTTVRAFVDAMIADPGIDVSAVIELLNDLQAQVRKQEAATLEDELRSIVQPLLGTSEHQLAGLLARFGWDGGDARTLEEAGEVLGVSRERVRQIQRATEQKLIGHAVWTPVLDRALRIIGSRLPLSATDMGTILERAAIAESPRFSAGGMIQAARLLRPGARIVLEERLGVTWLVDPMGDDQLRHVSRFRTLIQKQVSNQGIVSLDSVLAMDTETLAAHDTRISRHEAVSLVSQLDDYTLLNSHWIVHTDLDLRNPLVNRLNKMLAVWPAVPLAWAVQQVGREMRGTRRLHATPSALLAFVAHRPEYGLRNLQLVSTQELVAEACLSESEMALRECILASGGVATFGELEHAGLMVGIQKVTVAVTLKNSPLFFKSARNRHHTIGDGTAVSMILDEEEVQPDTLLDDEEQVIEEAHLPEDDLLFDRVDDVADLNVPAAAEPAPLPVSEREAGHIRAVVKQLLRIRGIVSLRTITVQHDRQFQPLPLEAIRAVAKAMDGVELIDAEIVTSLDSSRTNPISAGLRRMLILVPRLPIGLAVRQLSRGRDMITELDAAMLRAYIAIDDEFVVEGEVVLWQRPQPVTELLTPVEEAVIATLRDEARPQSQAHMLTRTGLPEQHNGEILRMLGYSELIEEVGRHRYRLFGHEERESRLLDDAAPADEALGVPDLPASDDVGPTAEPFDAVAASEAVAAFAMAEPEAEPVVEIDDAGLDLDAVDGDDTPLRDIRITRHSGDPGRMETTMISLGDLVSQARRGQLQLPEIQRGYVWKSSQVRTLVESLYHHYPVGTMLVWNTSHVPVARSIGRADTPAQTGPVSYLLDGQQRLTSLLRLIDEQVPDIRFNPFTQDFRTAGPATRNLPQWIPVHTVLSRGAGAALRNAKLDRHADVDELEARLERLRGILTQQVPVNRLSDFGYEQVTEIFVRVNSQGTRLRTAELAVANVAFQLPGLVSERVGGLRDRLADRGWDIDTQVLLRMLNAVATGQSSFGRLSRVEAGALDSAWTRTEPAVERFMVLLEQRLGLESVAWLPAMSALVVPVALLAKRDEREIDVDRLMGWFVRASVFGRYTGATETRLNDDLRRITDPRDPIRALHAAMPATAGRGAITLGSLTGVTPNSSYGLLFWLTMRRRGAVDLWTGANLASTRLAGHQELVRHQMFARSAGHRGFTARLANDLANVVLLAQEPELPRGGAEPHRAFHNIPRDWLQRQYIPTEPAFWRPDAARAFVEQRRRLLVPAMRETLRTLIDADDSVLTDDLTT